MINFISSNEDNSFWAKLSFFLKVGICVKNTHNQPATANMERYSDRKEIYIYIRIVHIFYVYNIYIHIFIYIYIHIYLYISNIYTYIHIYIHIHIYT